MCETIPCAGCTICYTELSTLLAHRPRWNGLYTDPVTPEFGYYIIKRSGPNAEGDYHESRLYGREYPNDSPYFYDNLNGSRYWSNPDGSTLYIDRRGRRRYTPATGPLTPPPSPPRHRSIPVDVTVYEERLLRVRRSTVPRDEMDIDLNYQNVDQQMFPARDVRNDPRSGRVWRSGGERATPSVDAHHRTPGPRGSTGQPISSTTHEERYSQSHRSAQHQASGSRVPATSPAPPPAAAPKRSTRDVGVGAQADDLDILSDRLNTSVRLSQEPVPGPNTRVDVASLPPIKLTGTVRNAQDMDEPGERNESGGGESSAQQTKRMKKIPIKFNSPSRVEHTYLQTPPTTPKDRMAIANSRTRRARGPDLPLQEKVTELYEEVAHWIKQNPNCDVRLGADMLDRNVERSATFPFGPGNRSAKLSMGVRIKLEPVDG